MWKKSLFFGKKKTNWNYFFKETCHYQLISGRKIYQEYFLFK